MSIVYTDSDGAIVQCPRQGLESERRNAGVGCG